MSFVFATFLKIANSAWNKGIARVIKNTKNRETKLRSSKNPRFCFTTYDNYVNQSSFEHERILCLFIVEIYYILMGNCATKEMFLFFVCENAMTRQQTSAGLSFLLQILNYQNLFHWEISFNLLKSKQTNEQAVLLTITQKNSSEFVITSRWNACWQTHSDACFLTFS